MTVLDGLSMNDLTDILSIFCFVLAIIKVGWIIASMNDRDEWTRRYIRVLMGFNLLACVSGFLLRPLYNLGIITAETRDLGAFMLRVCVISVLSLSLVTVAYRKWSAREHREDL